MSGDPDDGYECERCTARFKSASFSPFTAADWGICPECRRGMRPGKAASIEQRAEARRAERLGEGAGAE